MAKLQIGDKVLARGLEGTVIWLDPWDHNTVAVELDATGCVEEFCAEDCVVVNDRYKLAASKMFGVPYDQVTMKQRRKAKNWLYRLIYGGRLK